MRLTLFLITLALGGHVFGQALQTQTLPTATAISTALEVQRLAPQLVAFVGSDANFQNLVNGLATGTTVTLTTASATGAPQIVTFTPIGTMTAQQIAQTLEGVRQSLISRGIAVPTGQQLATALTGGALVTPAGTTAVNGVVATTTAAQQQQQSPAASIQNTFSSAAAGASSSLGTQTSASRFPRGISDTPPNAGLVPQTPATIVTPEATAATPQTPMTSQTTTTTPQTTAPLNAPLRVR